MPVAVLVDGADRASGVAIDFPAVHCFLVADVSHTAFGSAVDFPSVRKLLVA
jgi:hypothetical protein